MREILFYIYGVRLRKLYCLYYKILELDITLIPKIYREVNAFNFGFRTSTIDSDSTRKREKGAHNRKLNTEFYGMICNNSLIMFSVVSDQRRMWFGPVSYWMMKHMLDICIWKHLYGIKLPCAGNCKHILH